MTANSMPSSASRRSPEVFATSTSTASDGSSRLPPIRIVFRSSTGPSLNDAETSSGPIESRIHGPSGAATRSRALPVEVGRRRRGREEANEPGSPLVSVVVEELRQAFLLHHDDVVDGGEAIYGVLGVAVCGVSRSIVLADLLVVGLRPAPHHGGHRMRGGADIPASDAGPLIDLDRDDLAVAEEEGLVGAIEVEVDEQSGFDAPLPGRQGRDPQQ